MVPTFLGRLQTRAFVLLSVGLVWTILVTPFLPKLDDDLGALYRVTLTTLFIVVVLGLVVWEPIYHGLMQFRWEKDWPALFGLLTFVNEGLLAYAVLRAIGPESDPPVAGGGTFVVHFLTTWLVAFVFVNGPMRVPFLRWRFRGGRIV